MKIDGLIISCTRSKLKLFESRKPSYYLIYATSTMDTIQKYSCGKRTKHIPLWGVVPPPVSVHADVASATPTSHPLPCWKDITSVFPARFRDCFFYYFYFYYYCNFFLCSNLPHNAGAQAYISMHDTSILLREMEKKTIMKLQLLHFKQAPYFGVES